MDPGMYEKTNTVYYYICNELFLFSKDGFGIRRMASLCKLFGRHKDLEEKLNSSKLIHIPRTQNSRTYSDTCSARKQRSFVVNMQA